MRDSTLAGQLWASRSTGARVARYALRPASAVFRTAVAARNLLYDRHVLRSHRAAIPVVSVGNLAVGGTGKTPFAAWLARQLADAGGQPGIVLRGYGGDEQLVHNALNRDVPVFVGADRVAMIAAAASAGCDIAVLDDAHQHRRAARDEDIVLISADTWTGDVRPLPAGPWREPLSGLRRATLIVITAKAASREAVARVRAAVRMAAPPCPVAVVHLLAAELRALRGDIVHPVSELRGRKVFAFAAVADPSAFYAQLAELGASVTFRAFPDHHRFDESDVAALRAAASGRDIVVCTLKDAVKIARLWPTGSADPGAPPAWYVSQAVTVEDGAPHVAALIHRLLAARAPRNRVSAPAP
jgi:tetraacyldisaccharide 4'-kinase